MSALLVVCATGLAACTDDSGGGAPAAEPAVTDFVGEAAASDAVAVDVLDPVPVRVDGRRFQTVCAGEGEPAVLLVSGQATPQDTWAEVIKKVGGETRVCSYDRLGIGASGPLPARQTFETMAADLDGLVNALGLHRPLVVVGHSLGGAIAMTWAASHADDSAGVVLVDSSSPQYTRELARQLREHEPSIVEDDDSGNPEHVDDSVAWSQLEKVPTLGDVPLVVLAHSGADPNLFHPALDVGLLEEAWQDGQRHWAEYSTDAELVTVEHAGHFIQLDRPEVVVAAVLKILHQQRP